MNTTFKVTFGSIAMLAMTSTVFAKLGETLEQCKKRYGAPVASSEKDQSFDFKDKEVKINIRLKEDKVIAISYSSPDKEGIPLDKVMSLLVLNTGKGDWNIPERNYETEEMTWTHEDASRGATLDQGRLLLKVYALDPKAVEEKSEDSPKAGSGAQDDLK